MTKKLIEIREDGRLIYRYVESDPPPRSHLPAPHVISDEMPPVEQVDGKIYTSKSRFRAVGRALGLIEVGNEKVGPKLRSTAAPTIRQQRRTAIKAAIERYKAGHRPRRQT
jgi:hypothetical protein